MNLKEAIEKIETQYNLFHETKIKITLPKEIEDYELHYFESVNQKPYNIIIEDVNITQTTKRIVFK